MTFWPAVGIRREHVVVTTHSAGHAMGTASPRKRRYAMAVAGSDLRRCREKYDASRDPATDTDTRRASSFLATSPMPAAAGPAGFERLLRRGCRRFRSRAGPSFGRLRGSAVPGAPRNCLTGRVLSGDGVREKHPVVLFRGAKFHAGYRRQRAPSGRTPSGRSGRP